MGITPDVNEIAQLDKDLLLIRKYLAEDKWEMAKHIYTYGGENTYLDGEAFSFKNMSEGVTRKKEGTTELYTKYWGKNGYINGFVGEAVDGKGRFADADKETRKKAVLAGVIVHSTWIAVVTQLESAARCSDLQASLARLDDAWAYYAGSQESGSGTGVQLFSVSVSLSTVFDDLEHPSRKPVNVLILESFNAAQAAIGAGKCPEAQAHIRRIVSLLKVILIQGVIRSAFAADPKVAAPGATRAAARVLSTGARTAATVEGWVYASALLPHLAECDGAAAARLRANMEYGVVPYVPDGHVAVASFLRKNYDCLLVDCADVAGYIDNNKTSSYVPGLETCSRTDPFSEKGGAKEAIYKLAASAVDGSDVHDEGDSLVVTLEGAALRWESGQLSVLVKYPGGEQLMEGGHLCNDGPCIILV